MPEIELFEDHYEVLQLSPNAEPSIIQFAYTLLSQRYHPGNKDTRDDSIYEQLLKAKGTLSHPERRASYDMKYKANKTSDQPAVAPAANHAVDIAVDLGSDAVNFHAVAGGKENHLGQVGAEFQAAAVAMQPRGMNRQLFAQRHRRCLVTQTCDKDFHAFNFQVVRRTTGWPEPNRIWPFVRQPEAGAHDSCA